MTNTIEKAIELMRRLNMKSSYSGELTDHVTTWVWDNKKKEFAESKDGKK